MLRLRLDAPRRRCCKQPFSPGSPIQKKFGSRVSLPRFDLGVIFKRGEMGGMVVGACRPKNRSSMRNGLVASASTFPALTIFARD